MATFCPGVSYKLMDEGKAHLAHKLDEFFNAEPMIVEQRNKFNEIEKRHVKHKFEAYPKLNKKIQEHHDVLFGNKAGAEKAEDESAEAKVPLPFGYGALKSHRFGK